jgi:hypothetical protein
MSRSYSLYNKFRFRAADGAQRRLTQYRPRRKMNLPSLIHEPCECEDESDSNILKIAACWPV